MSVVSVAPDAESVGDLVEPQAAPTTIEAETSSLKGVIGTPTRDTSESTATVTASSTVVEHPEPSAPGTPPTAPHEHSAGQSSANSGDFSSMSLSSRSNSMALQVDFSDGCSVFFARVPPILQEDAILEVFEHYGPVQSINLYRRWAASKSSKGCGILTYKHPASANAAIEALNNKFFWKDGASCMVVERVDLCKLQRDTADRKRCSVSLRQRQPTYSFGTQVYKPTHAPTNAEQTVYLHTGEEWGVMHKGGRQHRQAHGDMATSQQWAPYHHQQQQGMPSNHNDIGRGGHVASQVPSNVDEQRIVAAPQGSPPPAQQGVGDPASYPYYGMPVGMPPQYFSGTVGAAPQMAYYYPMAYPNMPQYVWVPYMPGAGYPAPGYGAPGRTPLSDADAGQGSSSSVTRLESSDGHGRQVPGAPHIKDGSSKVFYGTVSHSHLQGGDAHPGSAPLVDSEQSALQAKQLTVYIKNCDTLEALQSLVYHRMAEMNHIHISAALGRMATIAAGSGQYNRSRPPLHLLQLIAQLMDNLTTQQLGNAKPFELCNSLSAAAKLGYRAPADQVQQMTAVFIDRLSISKPGEVCMMLSAASRMGYKVTELQFEQMFGAVLGSLQDCPSRRVQELLIAVDRMRYKVSGEQLQQLREFVSGADCDRVVTNSLTNLTLSST